MKEKGFKKYTKEKGRPNRLELISQRKEVRGKSSWDPRKCQSLDAQHSPN